MKSLASSKTRSAPAPAPQATVDQDLAVRAQDDWGNDFIQRETTEERERSAASEGPFDSGLLNEALSSCFGEPLGGLTASWSQEEDNEAIAAEASTEGTAMSFGAGLQEDLADPEAMEIVAHETAHALAKGGSGETELDAPGDPGEAVAEDAGKRFRQWAEQGFEGPAPSLKPAAGGRARVHRHGTAITGRPYLKVGSRGRLVSALQSLLNSKGHSLAVDGMFGPMTAAAVRAFQSASNLVPDGIVGPNTATALNGSASAPAPARGADGKSGGLSGDPELSFNSRGRLVSALQRRLNELGAELVVDGVFGAGTHHAVVCFQKENGLGRDGIFGPNTAAKLNSPNAKRFTCVKGEDTFQGVGGYDNLREAVMAAAASHLGKPYYWGADGPAFFDCSGFVLYVLRNNTKIINWGDDTAAGIRNRVPQTNSPKKGDLVFYHGSGGVSHIEFYTGTGTRTLGASGGGSRTFGNDPGAKVQYGNYSNDRRGKSFGSIEELLRRKAANS